MRQEVASKDLVIGKVYVDLPSQSEIETFLKYEGKDKQGDLLFTFVKGHNTLYSRDKKGRIPFFKSDLFYLPLEDEL